MVTTSLLEDVVSEQEACGLDVVTDGQIHWADPISHYLSRLRGVRWNASPHGVGARKPLKYPVIEAKLRRQELVFTSEYRQTLQAAQVPVKVVMTGPYTLSQLACIETTAYRSSAHLAADLSGFLSEEVASLVAAGATVIQIDEPLILHRPHDIRLLRELLDPLQDASGHSTQLVVATYSGDATPLYAQLNSLPADILALDLAGHDALCDAVASTGSSKPLAFGLIDGSSRQMEDPDAIARRLEMLIHRYVHYEALFQTSCGLANLPREDARAKLDLLAAVRNRLEGKGSEVNQ